MLVNFQTIMKDADEKGYAVPAFNVYNMETVMGIIKAAEEKRAPVIIQFYSRLATAGFADYLAPIVLKAAEMASVPVCMHLDHGAGRPECIRAMRYGATGVMIDASTLPIDENIAKTKELVAICEEKGLSIEAEVGSIGGEEDGVVGAGECADPNECKMIADLGVTMLAAGIGNIHGKYPENWAGLSFETLAAVQEKTGTMPLVLHGGTGIPADMIQKAISLGVSKINVNTECQLAFQEATRKYIEEGKDLQGKGFDPRKLLAPGCEAIKATVKEKIELFGSANKA